MGGAPPAPAVDAAPLPAATDGPLTSNGWGPLTIGISLDAVTAALGPDSNPDAVGGPDPDSCDEFRPANAPEGVLVMIEQGTLSRVSLIGRSTLKTDKGLGVGDTADAVKAAYGNAATVSPHKYQDAPAEYVTIWDGGARGDAYVQDPTARGEVYEIDSAGKVGAIHAGGPSIQYVEGCA